MSSKVELCLRTVLYNVPGPRARMYCMARTNTRPWHRPSTAFVRLNLSQGPSPTWFSKFALGRGRQGGGLARAHFCICALCSDLQTPRRAR